MHKSMVLGIYCMKCGEEHGLAVLFNYVYLDDQRLVDLAVNEFLMQKFHINDGYINYVRLSANQYRV